MFDSRSNCPAKLDRMDNMNAQQITSRPPLCLLVLLGLSLFARPVAAQVFDSGPSESTLFDTVINLPPAPDIVGPNQSIGDDGFNTQLNIFDGGSVDFGFSANSGSEVNINGGEVDDVFSAVAGSEVNVSGGEVGRVFRASSDSEVNISGGRFGWEFGAFSGSVVNISGGTFGRRFAARPDSNLTLIGGEFQLNGEAFSEDTISTSSGDVFSGTLADGSSFIFLDLGASFLPSDSLSGVQLTSATLPTLDLSPIVVSTSNPNLPSGLRPGQTLNLQDGGELGELFEMAGATLNMEGGNLGSFATATNSEINISGGSVDRLFRVLSGSVLNLSGGFIAIRFDAFDGSTVNVSGGSIESGFNAYDGSEINITGGSIEPGFTAVAGSVVNISGGTIGYGFEALLGSNVDFVGGEFQLNGEPFSGATISTNLGDTFTGTFADGSTFVFSDDEFSADSLSDVQLTSAILPALDLAPIIVSTPNPNLPSGLRTGQTLILQDGGELGINFEAINATLNVEGGDLGRFAGALNSEVNISGGSVGRSFKVMAGSEVNIRGGSIGSFFQAQPGSVINISGGVFDSRINVEGGSAVNLFGSDFALDGQPLNDSLSNDIAFTVVARDVTLSGRFEDGSAFSFDLNSAESFIEDFFSSNATLTVTLVPTTTLLGDCNLDGVVDFLDISPFIGILASVTFLTEADCNEDGIVDFLDIAFFIEILSAG